MSDSASRATRLDRAIADLLAQAPEVEAAAVVSFDGLPMASALPATMDEDRVAAMSAALLSLGERAAEGLGRGGLNQVYIEGEHGTVFLVSADDEAVVVAVASKGAKVGMMLFEVRRAADVVAAVLKTEPFSVTDWDVPAQPVAAAVAQPVAAPVAAAVTAPLTAEPVQYDAVPTEPVSYAQPVADTTTYATTEPAWPTYDLPMTPTTDQTTWS